MNLKEYTKLKDRVDSLRDKATRATGALEQIREIIKDEFGLSLEDATAHLETLAREQSKAKKQFDRELAKVLKQYRKKLT